MPAASDQPGAGDSLPELPRTWRPLGIRLAVVFFGTLLVLVCLAAWLGFNDSVRSKFTFLQLATVVGMIGVAGFVGWLLARARVTAAEDGIVVVNGLSTRRLAWEEVLAVHLPPGAPWAVLDLSDGTTISAMAFQQTDGDRAQRGVRELRALLDRPAA
jgi:hypothetical protein